METLRAHQVDGDASWEMKSTRLQAVTSLGYRGIKPGEGGG